MKAYLLLGSLLFCTSAFSSVVKSVDAEKKCNIYRVATEENPALANEVVINDTDVYGLSIQNIEVDFKHKDVTVDAMLNVILGLNRKLLNDRVTINSKNPDFTFLINQLNRKLFVFERMCITDSNELIYAKMFEDNADTAK